MTTSWCAYPGDPDLEPGLSGVPSAGSGPEAQSLGLVRVLRIGRHGRRPGKALVVLQFVGEPAHQIQARNCEDLHRLSYEDLGSTRSDEIPEPARLQF